MIIESRIEKGNPVVGMETTVFVHGLPRKEAIELFRRAKEISREKGFQLVVIGILKGKIIVGMSEEELETMMREGADKIGTREIPIAVAKGKNAATTVSATIFLSRRIGIEVVVTGGTGCPSRTCGRFARSHRDGFFAHYSCIQRDKIHSRCGSNFRDA